MSRDRFRLPSPPPPTPAPGAFIQMPVAALPPASDDEMARIKALYEWAFAEAQAAAAPSLLERDLLGLRN